MVAGRYVEAVVLRPGRRRRLERQAVECLQKSIAVEMVTHKPSSDAVAGAAPP